jgi:hypothetical protein
MIWHMHDAAAAAAKVPRGNTHQLVAAALVQTTGMGTLLHSSTWLLQIVINVV